MISAQLEALHSEMANLRKVMERRESFPDWLTYDQAERFLNMKPEPGRHRQLKRFLRDEGIKVKKFAKGVRISRKRVEAAMEKGLEYV